MSLLLCALLVVAGRSGSSERLVLEYAGGKPRVQAELARDLEGNLVFEGSFQTFHENGVRESSGAMSEGRRAKRWIFRHRNDQVRESGAFREGRRTGRWRAYDREGNKVSEGEYDRGARDGRWRFWDADGVPDVVRSGVFAPIRSETERGLTLDGKRHGPWTEWWPGGIRREEGTYERGVRVGDWGFWHADGSLDAEFQATRFANEPGARPRPALWEADASRRWGRPDPEVSLTEVARRFFPQPERLALPAAGADRDAVESYLTDLAGRGTALVDELVESFLLLDPEHPDDFAAGELYDELLGRVAWGASLDWNRADARTEVLRLLHLWDRARSLPQFWTIELALRPADTELTATWPKLEDLAPAERGFDFSRVPIALVQEGQCLARALTWIVAHQSSDGSFKAADFGASCAHGGVCDGRGDGNHDVGVTALATLALVRAGNTTHHGAHADAVRRAVLWILRQQEDDGRLASFEAPPGETRTQRIVVRPRSPGSTGGGGGGGFETRPCTTCGGRGFLLQNQACPTCGGDGRTNQIPAPPPPPSIGSEAKDTASEGSAHVFDHAFATLLLCELAARESSPALRDAARRALDRILESRNPYGAWRYSLEPKGDNDTAITGLMAVVLDAGRRAGFGLSSDARFGALNWFDEITDPASARTGYDEMGGFASRSVHNDHFPPEKSEAPTAVVLLGRLLLRETPDDDIAQRQADLLLRRLPEWDPQNFVCDLYYATFGTAAMARMGGRYWKAWEASLARFTLQTQRKDGGFAGSWDPVGPWGYLGGRVYSTAMQALTLITWIETETR